MNRPAKRFDLVFAADALIYLGELDAFFSAAARVTPPGALLAFNVETTDAAPYVLLPSGRFAHELSALRDAAASVVRAAASNRRRCCARRPPRRSRARLILFERRAA